MYINTIDEAIRWFRQTLPTTSRTAVAIDRQATLADISRCATEEGLHPLAAVLFEVQLTELYETREPDEVMPVTGALRDFCQHLPRTSKTAAALARRASWEELSQCVEAEGLRQHALAAVLCVAQQERLHHSTEVVG